VRRHARAVGVKLPPCEQTALDTLFEGDRELYLAYRAACLEQFPLDLQTGDALLAAREHEALRRLVHSLKGVLGSLGYSALALAARGLEEALAGEADWPELQPAWADLRQRMVASFGLKSP